jgi:DNA-binding IclR family transcriptional regulator
VSKPEDPVDDSGPAPADDPQMVAALQRGLEMLRCFHPQDQALGNQELAQRSGLPNSTVSRLTYTLSALGYLNYLEDIGKYRIAVPVLGLGNAYLGSIRAREVARPLMREVARFAGRGSLVGLGACDGHKMVYVACARGTGPVSLQLDVGSRISLSRSSLGKAYLAAASEAERAALMERLRAETDPRDWPRTEDGLLRAIEEIQTLGFCMTIGEWQPDVSSVGVPLPPRPGSSDPLLSCSCGAPSFLLTRDLLKNEIGPRLVEIARACAAN